MIITDVPEEAGIVDATTSVTGLRVRALLASLLIQGLQQDNDPRAPAAIKKLLDQQQQLHKMLIEKRSGKPATGSANQAVIIKCKPAAMNIRSGGNPAH